MSDSYLFPSAVGYDLYVLIRGLFSAYRASVDSMNPAPSPRVHLQCPEITEWTSDQELIAWRVWRLATFMSQTSRHETGPRLLSVSAPRIWDGPVVRSTPPRTQPQPPSGIYALKQNLDGTAGWRFFEDCWITGTVALSGRVVEHASGYRAERAVVRDLRLATATHLAVRSLDDLKGLIHKLECRYQVTVDVGQAERDQADRMLARGFKPEYARLGWVSLKEPWQLI